MRRLGLLLLVLSGTVGSGVVPGAGAVADVDVDGGSLRLVVSGPTAVMGVPAPRYVLTATITNASASAATGVTISSTFPDGDAREEITGALDCDDTGLNVDVCTLADIPAGGSAIVTFRYAPTEYGIDRHHVVVSSAAPALSAEADYDVRILPPDGSTDWRVHVTPAVGMGGLRARHQVVVTNLGPATATNVVFDESLLPGEELIATSHGAGCSLAAAELHCSVGTMPPRTSFTLRVDTKLPANPGDLFHVVGVGSSTPHVNASHLLGSAPGVDPWRYWMCALCISTTLDDGYELPGGFSVFPDETVHVADGSVIGRDGVLRRADGRLVLADGTVTLPPAAPPAAPAGVTAVAGDGKALVAFDEPAPGALPGTGYVVTASPGGYVYSGDSSPITAVGLANGTAYSFTVAALNGAGAGPASAASNVVTPAGVPEPPTGVSADGGDGAATVTFAPSSSPGVLYYTATAFPGGKSARGTESPIAIPGLANGMSYTISVAATSAVGAGPDSLSSNAVVPAESSRPHPDPPAESDLRAPPPEPPPTSGPRPRPPAR